MVRGVYFRFRYRLVTGDKLDSLNNALDMVYQGLAILVIVWGIIVGGSKLVGTSKRVDKHEDECAKRYDKFDKNISDLHEKINSVAVDVAEIKGSLKNRE